MNTGLLIGIGVAIIVLLLLSALFSFSEMALASVNKIRLQAEAKKSGSRGKRARRALKFVNTYNETVTSIVIMNNIVNILGTTLATVFFSGIFSFNPAIGAVVSFVTMTLLTISVGEVTPKVLARKHNLNGVIFFSMVLQITVWTFWPVTWLINKFVNNHDEVMLETDEDIKAALVETAAAGNIEDNERELLINAVELDNKSLSRIMIPAEEVEVLKSNANKKIIQNALVEAGHTRYPVVNSDDEVIGIYNTKFFIADMFEGRQFKLDRSMYETSFFTKEQKLDDVLTILRTNRQHMGIVVDKKSSRKMIGIVTIEDIVEEIVGELYDESDREQDGIMDIDPNHFAIHPDALAKDVLKEVFKSKSKAKSKQTFEEWMINKFDIKELEPDTHYTFNNALIWVKEDKRTNREGLSFEIDLIEQ